MKKESKTIEIRQSDRAYPARLLDLDEPPEVLRVRGSLRSLEDRKTVAIVGSRKATVRGVRLARQIARDLATAGVVVISGGALGIDIAAHRGCLDANAPTISVLAGGVDAPTPRRNADVFADIVGKGALLSEYPDGTSPRRFHYHRRNDLIAALGDATLVVRAKSKSGTMITARAARRIGRPLCALPGALDDPLAAGCHELLVAGAQCVRGASDILDHVLGLAPAQGQLDLHTSGGESAPRAASTRERAIEDTETQRPLPAGVSDNGVAVVEAVRELGGEQRKPVTLDQLKRHLDWSISQLNTAVLEVELAGAISKKPGANAYVLR